MKRKKKKNQKINNQPAKAENTAEEAVETAETTDPVEEKQADAPEKKLAEKSEKKLAEGENKEEFDEEKISDGENKRLHDRFRFDWELEEHLIEALDEDASELTEPEETEPEPIEVRSVSLAQVAQAAFGLFVLIFTIIGVVSTFFKVRDVIEAKKDNSAQIAYFEDFLMPLVASDAPIFDGAASLNEDVVITAACWDIIFNPSVYYEYTNGNYVVSYQDIDRRIAKLFGPGLVYTHKTVGDTELTFEYNEETGMYTIPAYPRSPAYYCEITSIDETAAGLELTVCYKLPITNWIESLDTVEKTMIYTVTPSDTDYNVTAIRIGEIVTSEAV